MNFLFYGVPAPVIRRIAERYGLRIAEEPDRTRREKRLIPIVPTEHPRRLLELCNAMLRDEAFIDMVVVRSATPCELVSTMRYCAPQDKLFAVGDGTDEQELFDEIVRIIDAKSGRLCAHDGID